MLADDELLLQSPLVLLERRVRRWQRVRRLQLSWCRRQRAERRIGMGGCRLTFAANSSAERIGGDVEGDELQAATVRWMLAPPSALSRLRRRCSRSVHTKRRNGCLQRASIGRAHVHQVLWGDLAAEAEVFAKLTTLLRFSPVWFVRAASAMARNRADV